MEDLKVDQFCSGETLANESVGMNNLNVESRNEDNNVDRSSYQTLTEDNILSETNPSYQKIIKISLLSEEVKNKCTEDPRSPIAEDVAEENASEESLTESKVSSERSDEDFSRDQSEKASTLSSIKRSTSEIKDLIEEGQDLHAKEDMETKLESVYENGRVVEDQENFEVILNVKRFLNGSMSVKSKGHHIFLVDAQADDVNDPGNKIYLTRRFFIPGRVNMQKTSTSLSSDGILVISVPKLPELKIPKSSDDLSCCQRNESSNNSQTSISSDTRSSPAKNDLESRFRDSNEKIRTESPTKLERSSNEKIRTESPTKLELLEAKIKARKEASEKSKVVDEKSRSYNEKDNRHEDTFEKEDFGFSRLNKKQDDDKFNVNIEGKKEESSRFGRGSEDDFFSDRDWNTREKKDSKDWIRDYVGKYVDDEDWFGSSSRDKDFFDTDRRRQEANKKRESRREWIGSKFKDSFEDKLFETKDIFGTQRRDFFKDDDDDDKFFSRRNKKSCQDDFLDKTFSRSRGDEFSMRNRGDNHKDSFEDRAKGDNGNNKKMYSCESSRQYSSSTSTDNKNKPETERKESFNKQEFSSSSKNKSTKNDFDDVFSSSRDDSEAQQRKIDDLKEDFRTESELSFDFPIVRRGRFFQDSFFNDTKEDFDSVLDRFRQEKIQRFGSKADDTYERYSTNIGQQNKRQKTVISEDDTCFKIELPVVGIKEETLTVKELIGNEVLIEAQMKHEDGIFRKHIMFPIHGDFKKAKSFLAADGVLIIKVPKINTN